MLAMKAFTHPCLQANTTLETELIDGCWFLMNPLFSRGTVAAEEEAWLACSQVHKNYISYRSLKKKVTYWLQSAYSGLIKPLGIP